MMHAPETLEVEKLRALCDAKSLGFKDTSELKPLAEFINQERAISALNLGLTHTSDNYNIVVVSAHGSGINSVLNELIREVIRSDSSKKVPPDLCYVFNFDLPQKPFLVTLPAGRGKKFRERMLDIYPVLEKEINELLQGPEIVSENFRLNDELTNYYRNLEEEFKKRFSQDGAEIVPPELRAQTGIFIYLPRPDGQKIPLSAWVNVGDIDDKERKRRQRAEKQIWEFFREIEQKIIHRQKELNDGFERYRKKKITDILEKKLTPIKKEFDGHGAIRYFEGLEKHIIRLNDVSEKKPEQQIPQLMPNNNNNSRSNLDEVPLPFQVNVFVDNSGLSAPPVVEDIHSTFQSIFGQIAGPQVVAMPTTNNADHARIIAGSLAKANGGIFIIDALHLFQIPEAWKKLVNTIKSRELKIEGVTLFPGVQTPINIDPEPSPVKARIVLVCPVWFYRETLKHPVIGDKMRQFFRIKAEFKDSTERTLRREKQYAEFIALCAERENLRPFSADAVAKIIEYGSRLTSSQKRLSLEMTSIKDIALEANWVASQKKPRPKIVMATHVSEAINNKVFRAGLIREKVHSSYREGKILFNPAKTKVGQVYGLAVLDTGELKFGVPSRITVQTYASKNGRLLSIDRNAKLSGPVFAKAIEIVSSYLQARYAKEKPLAKTISISFEQQYGIEGDSATAAEIFATLSALSNVPLRQDIAAVTGSANQLGEIQPIGGVNEKIEGFFDVCAATCGIKGKGVIIPIQNVQDLMLREDVVMACTQKKFKIFAIRTVEEGMELLAGKSMGEIDRLVHKNLNARNKKVKRKKE